MTDIPYLFFYKILLIFCCQFTCTYCITVYFESIYFQFETFILFQINYSNITLAKQVPKSNSPFTTITETITVTKAIMYS